MNHAGIGKINKESNVYLPIDLLSPLSIVDDVMIWGILYPPGDKYQYDLMKKAKYDFVLSPIPFDLWGKVGRIKIRLKNIPGTHEKIAEQIYSLDGSILISEASRSAHSYDTWTIVITFDDIDVIDYDQESKTFVQTLDKLDELRKKIIENCREIIFVDKNDPNMKDLIRVTSYNALSYFYNVVKNKPEGKSPADELAWSYYKPFCLTGKNNGVLSPDRKFRSIMENIKAIEAKNLNDVAEISSHKVYCELDTNDINLRMTLIPNREERKFFSASIEFKKAGPENSSRGFLKYILSVLPRHYSVWGLISRTMCFSPEREVGRADLVIEDKHLRSDRERERELESILNENYPENIKHILPMSVSCKTIGSVYRDGRDYNNGIKNRYDVFFSYASENESNALEIFSLLKDNGFSCFMSAKNLKTGDDFTEEIREALCKSKEILLLYSKQSEKSSWIKREFGAAWALQKLITPVVLNMDISDLPDWLNSRQACMFHEVKEKYLIDLKDR